MSLSSSYPDGYEVYAVGKILRQKATYNAYERHGFVWYTPLEGPVYIHELCRKAAEESKEVVIAHDEWQFERENLQRRVEILGELGDLSDVMDSLGHENGEEFLGTQSSGNLNMVLQQWQQWAETFTFNPATPVPFARIAESVSYTRNSIRKYLGQWEITRQELADARRKKIGTKGPLLHGRVEFLALPSADEWISHFRERFRVINPQHLSAPPSPHPHLLP